MAVRNLDKLFCPHRVAVLGAANGDGGACHAVLHNLLGAEFQGVIYPVIPQRESVSGVPCFGNALMLPHPADLAVICRPADQVAAAVRECGIAGIAGVLVLSSGFRERDDGGVERLAELRAVVGDYPEMRVMGPNSLGVINTSIGLNASLSPVMPRPGYLTFLSQSRSLSSAIIDRAVDKGVRLAHFVSVGHMMNVSLGDLIDYFGGDARTRSLILYLHAVAEPRSFMSAARAFARIKPIVAYKAGRHAAAAQATASHTGQLVAEDLVYEAAFQRAGIVRTMELDDLFDVAELLAAQRLPRGARVGIVSNSAAAAVVAVDHLQALGGEPADLADETVAQLTEACSACRPTGNPVNVGEDSSADCFARVTEVMIRDANVDAAIVLITPQLRTQPEQTARQLATLAQSTAKPILAACIGGERVRQAMEALNQAGVPAHNTPEHAVRAFMHLVTYARNLQMIYETPRELSIQLDIDRDQVRAELRALTEIGRTVLDPIEAERVLTTYGIPMCPLRVAATNVEAMSIAEELHCNAVVLKALTDPPIAHKTDIGGVALGLRSAEEVAEAFDRITAAVRASGKDVQPLGVTVQPMVYREQAFEMILGARKDPTFGPVVMIGMGGVATDVIQDRTVGLPPLNERLARHMLESLRAWPLLRGYRGRPGINVDKLIEQLIRFSHLVADHPAIAEIDINPLIVTDHELIAVDATVLLDPNHVAPARPYQQLAIRPYPEEYIRRVTLKDGSGVCLRPIRPEDEPAWHDMLQRCSDTSIRHRFRSMFQRMTHEMASRYCFIDYDREITLVGEVEQEGARMLIAAGGLCATPDQRSAEFSVLVADAWQGNGLGGMLLDHCLQIARSWRLVQVVAETAADNRRMLDAFDRRGFHREPNAPDDDTVVVSRRL